MRNDTVLTDGWTFIQNGTEEAVTLPHTWNADDGQNRRDYYRGKGLYRRILPEISAGNRAHLYFEGVNSVCHVYVNGAEAGEHRGGYSGFTVDVTPYLRGKEDVLEVEADNSDFPDLFPTTADFTFYGGIYRPVHWIETPSAHFDFSAGTGVFATPSLHGAEGVLNLRASVVNPEGNTVRFLLRDHQNHPAGNVITTNAQKAEGEIRVPDVRRWNGKKDPYLYTLTAQLLNQDNTVLDSQKIKIGFREILFNEETGFTLNGERIRLNGVSRHQDREGKGNALSEADHREDVALILESGANAVRLAHYQQSQYFYDLCDEAGLLVWAEVPVISAYRRKKLKNAMQQLRELIQQSYHHPSIFCWGIANEITIRGEGGGLQKGLQMLNARAKSLDATRPTAMAQFTMCPVASELNEITDLLGYNHYFGWYFHTTAELKNWLDEYHARRPKKGLALTEYGAEGILKYQGANPKQGDYSEGYQAVYHEDYMKILENYDWVWGTFLWNFFEFGSAMRDEGGVKGRNNKGLVSFDRKIKKDAFYLYKAYWSEEPFVHLCDSRYVRRAAGEYTVKVYSNLPTVTLRAGDYERTLTGDKIFRFENVPVPMGEIQVSATAGDCTDSAIWYGQEADDPAYTMPGECAGFIRNWFESPEVSENADCYSLQDKVGDLLDNAEIKTLLRQAIGGKADSVLLKPLRPFRAATLLKLPFVKKMAGEEMIGLANGYLQTIKKNGTQENK